MKIRKALKKDLPHIIRLLANDQLGQTRESYAEPLSESYYKAFEQIDSDRNQELVVMENENAEVVGTLQLTFIPYLTYRGSMRAQIEAVRIREDMRGTGAGSEMIRWAIERAKEKKIPLIQLTTDKKRSDAMRFYEKLGFRASHEGMKLHLNP